MFTEVLPAVTVRATDLRRVLLDATRGPCDCPLCVTARRRIRAAAWPNNDQGTWPEVEEPEHHRDGGSGAAQ